MKLVWRSLQLLVLLALGLWLWSVLFPRPEKIIRKQLAGVARAASFAANEGPVAFGLRTSKLGGYFSLDAQVNLDAPGHDSFVFTGRNEIMQIPRLTVPAGALTVEFLDVWVKLAADKQSATVDLAASAKIPREPDLFVQEMKFVLKKINRKWLIVRVETVKTLSHARVGEVGRVTPCAPFATEITDPGAHGVRLSQNFGVTRPTFPSLATCHLSPA